MKDYTSNEDNCNFFVSITFHPFKGVDFYSFELIPKDFVPLLERAMEVHVSLSTKLCNKRDITRYLWFSLLLDSCCITSLKLSSKILTWMYAFLCLICESSWVMFCELGWLDELLKNVMGTHMKARITQLRLI
jgi:hypothetical protein